MNTKQIPIAVFIFAVFQLGCSDLDVTRSQTEREAFQKILSGQYVLIKSDELAQLKRAAEIGKIVGQYPTHKIRFSYMQA
jgi:hypothetical protein